MAEGANTGNQAGKNFAGGFFGCLGWVAGIVAVIFVLLILSAIGSRDSDSNEPAQAANENITCDTAAAKTYFMKAQRLGIIRGADVTAKDGAVVVVSARKWRSLSLEQQKSIAAATDCAVAGPGYLMNLRFREDRSGADLYSLSAYDLLKLRRDHYAP